jgi:transposase
LLVSLSAPPFHTHVFYSLHDFPTNPSNIRRGKKKWIKKKAERMIDLFCFSRNWTFPLDRLAYDREGGLAVGGKRRKFSAGDKVRILRRHLVDKVPVSDLCDEQGLHPTLFYKWQKEFFENGAAAFERGNDGKVRRLEKENTALKVKIAHKDEVIAEIMESHVALKKSLGEN